MKRYWVLWAALFAVGLTAGVVLAAMSPGGPGGGRPGPDQGGEGRPMGPPPPPPPPPLVALLEAKMGKPLMEDQRAQIREAGKANHGAMKQVIDAFLQQVAQIAGVTVEEIQSLIPPPPPPGGQGPPREQGQKPAKHDGQTPPPGGRKPPMKGGPAREQGQAPPSREGQTPPAADGIRPPPRLPPLFRLGDLLIRALDARLGKQMSPEQVDKIHAAEKAALEAAKPIHEAFVQELADITSLTPADVRECLPKPPPPRGGPGGQSGGPEGGGPQGGRHGPGAAAQKKVPV